MTDQPITDKHRERTDAIRRQVQQWALEKENSASIKQTLVQEFRNLYSGLMEKKKAIRSQSAHYSVDYDATILIDEFYGGDNTPCVSFVVSIKIGKGLLRGPAYWKLCTQIHKLSKRFPHHHMQRLTSGEHYYLGICRGDNPLEEAIYKKVISTVDTTETEDLKEYVVIIEPMEKPQKKTRDQNNSDSENTSDSETSLTMNHSTNAKSALLEGEPTSEDRNVAESVDMLLAAIFNK